MAWLDQNQDWLARAERWWPSRVEPLRITFELADEIAWDDRNGLTALEGTLQWQVIARETNRVPSDVFRGCDAKPMIPIPIEHVTIAGPPIARCSWGIPATHVDSVRWMRKRARVEALNLPRVAINGGAYKSLQFPVATLTTPHLYFFVRGDRGELEELLRDVVALGRGRGSAIGVVHRWGIDDDPEDRSLIHRNRPQRALPIALDGGSFDPLTFEPGSYVEREMTTRAPFWKRGPDVAVCAVPATARLGA